MWCAGDCMSANWQCCVFNCLFLLPPLPLPSPPLPLPSSSPPPLPLPSPPPPFPSECTAEVPQCYATGGTRTTCTIPWGNPQYWSIELTLSLLKSKQTDMRHKDATDWKGTCVQSSAHVHTACLTAHCLLLCWSNDAMVCAVRTCIVVCGGGLAAADSLAQQPIHTHRQTDGQTGCRYLTTV